MGEQMKFGTIIAMLIALVLISSAAFAQTGYNRQYYTGNYYPTNYYVSPADAAVYSYTNVAHTYPTYYGGYYGSYYSYPYATYYTTPVIYRSAYVYPVYGAYYAPTYYPYTSGVSFYSSGDSWGVSITRGSICGYYGYC